MHLQIDWLINFVNEQQIWAVGGEQKQKKTVGSKQKQKPEAHESLF